VNCGLGLWTVTVDRGLWTLDLAIASAWAWLKGQLHLFLPVSHGKGMTIKRSRIMERTELSLRKGRLIGLIGL
jgi:hypothetical protein